jgi:hypothetical protein
LQDDGPLLHAKLINKKLFGLFEFVENFEWKETLGDLFEFSQLWFKNILNEWVNTTNLFVTLSYHLDSSVGFKINYPISLELLKRGNKITFPNYGGVLLMSHLTLKCHYLNLWTLQNVFPQLILRERR